MKDTSDHMPVSFMTTRPMSPIRSRPTPSSIQSPIPSSAPMHMDMPRPPVSFRYADQLWPATAAMPTAAWMARLCPRRLAATTGIVPLNSVSNTPSAIPVCRPTCSMTFDAPTFPDP